MEEEKNLVDKVLEVVSLYNPISLADTEKVSLMNRIDKKYVFHLNLLPQILGDLLPHYDVLEIDNLRLMRYFNTYFDTQNLKFYHDHHRGMANRLKIRNRQYVESKIAFVELKRKNNKKKTLKSRVKVKSLENSLPEEGKLFLQKNLPANENQLSSPIEIRFSRISLISKSLVDRITFDIMLSAKSAYKTHHFTNLVVAELKKGSLSAASDTDKIFRNYKLQEHNFSKYCMGMVTTYPELKINRFKPTLLTLKKLNIGNA